MPANFFRYMPSKYPEWEGVRSGLSWFFTFRFLDLLSLPQLRGEFRMFRSQNTEDGVNPTPHLFSAR